MKLGKFAKRVATKTKDAKLKIGIAKANTALAEYHKSKVVKAPETEAQRRASSNRVPTQKEAREFAEQVAKGVKKYPTTRPLMVAIVPRVEVKQAPPYKSASYKK